MLHCWKGYREHLEDIGKLYSDEWAATYIDGNKTCLRERGHDGEHEFVDDSSIEITLKEH